MPIRASSDRRAAERAAQRNDHAAERDAERGPPGRAPSPAQAALIAVALASMLWLVARMPDRTTPPPAAAPASGEASR